MGFNIASARVFTVLFAVTPLLPVIHCLTYNRRLASEVYKSIGTSVPRLPVTCDMNWVITLRLAKARNLIQRWQATHLWSFDLFPRVYFVVAVFCGIPC